MSKEMRHMIDNFKKLLIEAEEKISYTAVVLTEDSHNKLKVLAPEGWDTSKTSHHCTLNMGKAKENAQQFLGQKVKIKVKGFVQDEKVCAVGVELPQGMMVDKGVPPHVTVAITGDGKPFQAGKLDYSKMQPVEGMPTELEGVVMEVPEGVYKFA